MKNHLLSYVFIFLALAQYACQPATSEEKPAESPRIWMSYKQVENFDTDFRDLKAHQVGAISVNDASPELIEAARKHDLKLIIDFPEVSEKAYLIPEDKVERAVMIGGAYNGKAIDRFRFSFTPQKHEILIENPIYDKENCYGDLGHYFPGMHDPHRAEVLVKTADFDGEPHVKIIPAEVLGKENEHFWKIGFDLTGVEGDLDQVGIAVYWITEGTRDYWMFGDNASTFAQSTRDYLKEAVQEELDEWTEANGGEFPHDLVIAARFGDECWHLSSHLNSDACSYPLWDYSESAIQSYQKINSQHYPRGKGWTDMFGKQAYADWMYNFHTSTAEMAGIVKTTLEEAGLGDLKLFRNITRYNVFNTLNDYDGSGLDLQAQYFDIVHLDPYPVNARGYRDHVIPVDMAYASGLARRHQKMLIPWLQAHQYWPERGGLGHPDPQDITKMVKQHEKYNPEAIMWLGYNNNNHFGTFPYENKESWAKAGEMHQWWLDQTDNPINAKVAVIRPYSIRALRATGSEEPVLDNFITDQLLDDLVLQKNIYYDAFEPRKNDQLNAEELENYQLVISQATEMSSVDLKPFMEAKTPTILFLSEPPGYNLDYEISGVLDGSETSFQKLVSVDQHVFTLRDATLFKVRDGIDPVLTSDGQALAWKMGDVLYVSGWSEESEFIDWIWKQANEEFEVDLNASLK